MIRAIKDWYGDIRFPAPEYKHTVEVTNAYGWVRPHMARITIRPEIREWLENEVEGRYIIHYEKFNWNPKADPRDQPCSVSFSREHEAIMFKLTFS